MPLILLSPGANTAVTQGLTQRVNTGATAGCVGGFSNRGFRTGGNWRNYRRSKKRTRRRRRRRRRGRKMMMSRKRTPSLFLCPWITHKKRERKKSHIFKCTRRMGVGGGGRPGGGDMKGGGMRMWRKTHFPRHSLWSDFFSFPSFLSFFLSFLLACPCYLLLSTNPRNEWRKYPRINLCSVAISRKVD